MQQDGLPPINAQSSLLALPPIPQHSDEPPTDATPMNFDTSDLQHALPRSRQLTGTAGGLRRATSAPHSMDTLGNEPQAGYLPPSGGPMRRVSSSLGMRRSSSFFWTPSAHNEFERAMNDLAARGAEVTAAAIMAEMRRREQTDLTELKLPDVDKHFRKKMLVQNRVLQNLSERPPLVGAGAPPASSLGSGSTPASAHGFRGHSVPGLQRPSQMAVVAEEQDPAVTAAAAAATAAAAAAFSDGLAQQFNAQRMQHLQLAAARESLLSHAEAQIIAQQQAEAH